MTTVWVVVGFFAVLAGLAIGALVWRGRARLSSGDDLAAGRDARARQQRYETERYGDQGGTWQRGRESSG